MISKFYRFIKSRVGCSLKRTHCRRHLVPSGSKLHINYLELKAVFLALQEFQDLCIHKIVLVETDNTTVVSYINRDGGMRSGPLGFTMENLDLVRQKSSNSKSLAHSRPAECGRRQAIIQARPDHPNRVVSPSGGLPSNMQQVTPASNRPICHEVQQQVALVCVTGTRSPGYSSECAQSAMVGSGSIHLPTISHIGQSGVVAGLPIQENHSDCSGVPNHALVLGSSGHVQPNPTEPAQSAHPVDTTI